MSLILSQVSIDYLDSLRYERGCSQVTFATYQAWLHNLQKWLTTNGHEDSICSFTTAILRSYQYSLSKRNLRPRTIRSAFNAIRGLGKFMVAHDLLPTDPTQSISLPKKDAALRLTITDEEVSALLGAVERLYPARRVALARAMIHTLVFTGVRFREWLDLKVGDVSLQEGTILIANGKGAKSRKVYPPTECMDVIKQWLALRGNCKVDWLWTESPARRMGEIGTRNLLEEIKSIAGLQDHENIKPHSLRHAFATRMMENGAPIKTIQAALGHSLLATTAIYLHLGEKEAQKMSQYAVLKPAAIPAVKRVQAAPVKPTRSTLHQARRQRIPK